MLLARLQCEAVGGVAGSILRDADESTRELALQARAHCHVARVRPAESHRHTEALGCSDGNVSTKFAGRGEECQRKQVGRNDRDTARLFDGGDDLGRIPHPS